MRDHDMICPTCAQAEYDEREPLYGAAQIRCGCGLRAAPRTIAVPPPAPSKALRHGGNGHMKGGVFYGTCRSPSCGAAFESKHPKHTCGSPACIRWAKTRTGRMVQRTCACGTPYLTREAHQGDYCGDRCRQRGKNLREATKQRARRLQRPEALPL